MRLRYVLKMEDRCKAYEIKGVYTPKARNPTRNVGMTAVAYKSLIAAAHDNPTPFCVRGKSSVKQVQGQLKIISKLWVSLDDIGGPGKV